MVSVDEPGGPVGGVEGHCVRHHRVDQIGRDLDDEKRLADL
jgi:hypothetical protein